MQWPDGRFRFQVRIKVCTLIRVYHKNSKGKVVVNHVTDHLAAKILPYYKKVRLHMHVIMSDQYGRKIVGVNFGIVSRGWHESHTLHDHGPLY